MPFIINLTCACMILLFVLFTSGELIRHAYTDKYMCDLLQNTTNRNIVSCTYEEATDWILDQEQSSIIISNYDSKHNIYISEEGLVKIGIPDKKSMSKLMFDTSNGIVHIKYNNKCVTYHDNTNTYSMEYCTDRNDQKFMIRLDNNRKRTYDVTKFPFTSVEEDLRHTREYPLSYGNIIN